MSAKKENPKRKEDTSALIHQEWELVLAGKDAGKLAELLYEYEMDLLTNPIESNSNLIEMYARALLINGDYLELSFFLARTKIVEL
jgi:hypothetical protein